jgi:hypothetical protein
MAHVWRLCCVRTKRPSPALTADYIQRCGRRWGREDDRRDERVARLSSAIGVPVVGRALSEFVTRAHDPFLEYLGRLANAYAADDALTWVGNVN